MKKLSDSRRQELESGVRKGLIRGLPVVSRQPLVEILVQSTTPQGITP